MATIFYLLFKPRLFIQNWQPFEAKFLLVETLFFSFCRMLTKLPIHGILPLSWVFSWSCVLTNNLIRRRSRKGSILDIPPCQLFLCTFKKLLSPILSQLSLFIWDLYCMYALFVLIIGSYLHICTICYGSTCTHSQDLRPQWLSIQDLHKCNFLISHQIKCFFSPKLKHTFSQFVCSSNN